LSTQRIVDIAKKANEIKRKNSIVEESEE